MNIPSVSIIMPLYNKEQEVARALKSVFVQTINDFELIIVNDGSTDKGPEIVKSFDDHRVRVIDQDNGGVSYARNRGIAESQADLIAFLDADDEWEPDFLKTIIRLGDKFPSCEVLATNYSYRGGDDNKRPTIIRGLPQGFKEGILSDYFEIAAQSDPPLWTSAVAVKRKAINMVEGFPEGVTSGEDLATWAKLAVKYDLPIALNQKHDWETWQLIYTKTQTTVLTLSVVN